jgi:hypothetical protein
VFPVSLSSSIIEWPVGSCLPAASDIASWAQSELWGTCHEEQYGMMVVLPSSVGVWYHRAALPRL